MNHESDRKMKDGGRRKKEKKKEGVEGDRQIREMHSDFASFFSYIFYLHCFTKAVRLSVLRNTTRKVHPCQIGDTLFGDCTRTLLSPSGVSEET